jgi:hypothetical protein
VTSLAQSAATLWVIGVEALLDQLSPAQWVVVCDCGDGELAQRAGRITGQHGRPEQPVLAAAMATRRCRVSPSGCLLVAVWTACAPGWSGFWASGCAAGSPCPGHWCPLGCRTPRGYLRSGGWVWCSPPRSFLAREGGSSGCSRPRSTTPSPRRPTARSSAAYF